LRNFREGKGGLEPQGSSRRKKGVYMHMKRWLTGIISAPFLIYMIGVGPRWLFYLFLFVAAITALAEFYRMAPSRLPKVVQWFSYFIALLLFLIFAVKQVLLTPVIIALWAIVPMTFYMLTHPVPDEQWIADMGRAVLGPIYICLPLAMLILIDMSPGGNIWIFFLLIVIFTNDTGAFYSGRLFGRHKLYESVSPNKTWEGSVGGMTSSLIVALIFLYFFKIHELKPDILILVLLLSVMAQIGDLVESMLKRIYGIKDSGRILPGHGGLLDRIDALLFSIPVLYIYLTWTI
jgi:phosphatidate cytidylyltransferase